MSNTNSARYASEHGNASPARELDNGVTTAENVDFDLDSFDVLLEDTLIDPSRDADIDNTTNLDDFFSRPVLIHEYNWDVATNFYQTFNPWTDYFSDARVINRLCHYHLLRCNLKVRIQLNGNSFYYGKLLCSYVPLKALDQMSRNANGANDFTTASQLPNCEVSSTLSEGAEMKLPMIWIKNSFSIPLREWENMGSLTMRSYSTLRTANGATNPISIAIYAWAEDVKFGGLTSIKPSTLVPQGDEYSVKPVSRLASAVANWSGKFKDVPYIGKYAKATSIGASATSDIASLFGYSKPLTIDTAVIQRKAKAGLANYNTQDDAHKLALDVKQEVTIDPRVVGSAPRDEMSIVDIASRPSIISIASWDATATPGAILFSTVVDPCVCTQAYPAVGEFLLPAVAFATFPFKYWRGSLMYSFDFICTPFHKGRVKITYDPAGVPNVGLMNVNRSLIVDLDTTKRVEFCVPWSQSSAFKQHIPFGSIATWMGNGPITPPNLDLVSNGVLTVSVLNKLTSPHPVEGHDIRFVVRVFACDDFEVACPSSYDLVHMRNYADPNYNAGASIPLEPEAKEENVTCNTMVSSTSKNVNDLIHFGESIKSFRSLVKRYCFHEMTFMNDEDPDAGAPNSVHAFFTRPFLPMQGGYCPDVAIIQAPVYQARIANKRYVYASTTYINYITQAYVGMRGGIRYLVDSTNLMTHNGSIAISRNCLERVPYGPAFIHPTYTNQVVDPTCWPSVGIVNQIHSNFNNGMNGSSLSTNTVDGITTVELPYYSKYRFIPTRRFTSYDGGSKVPLWQNYGGCWSYTLRAHDISQTELVSVWCSGAEDFSAYFFLGAPPLFYEREFLD
jgi:hypothetical protein